MIREFSQYTLILSDKPKDVFDYYGVVEMHGLNIHSDVDGFCNVSPIDDKPFVYINLSKCTDDIHTMGLVMHETMHLASYLWNHNLIDHEEAMITFAELEAYNIVQLIKNR